METDPIKVNRLILVTALVVAIETAARMATALGIASALTCTALARLVMIILLFFFAKGLARGTASIGLARSCVFSGIRRGLVWSACFGVLAGFGFIGCLLVDIDPLGLFNVSLPSSPWGIASYFIVGVGLAPVAEELYFRGYLFGWLRRFGSVVAVIVSSLIFVAAHPSLQPVPVTQLIGGLVFAISYEIEKNLMVPIMIHGLGNAALFSLSFLA